jgi:pimeloyl-ACP methyl ester carboxylesterase
MLDRFTSLAAVLMALVVSGQPAAAETPRSETVAVDGIGATFTRPDKAAVAVLILPGSGPTDRDGNSVVGLQTDAYKHLAEALAKSDIASLRYDKRGIGASRQRASGAGVKEDELTIQTSAGDAVALVGWAAKQPGISRVVLVGHSEGAIVALLAARQTKVDRIALLTAPGFPLGQVLRKQFSRQPIPEDTMAGILRTLEALEAGKDPGHLEPPLDQLFRPSVQPFLRSVLTLAPPALLKDVGVPVLVVGGGSDQQLGRFDFDELTSARPGVEALWIPAMAHTLKPQAPDDDKQTRAYTDRTLPLAQELVDGLVKFIGK